MARRLSSTRFRGGHRVAACLRTIILAAGFSAAASAPVIAQMLQEDPLQGDGRVSPFYSWTRPLPGGWPRPLPAEPGRILRFEPLPAVLGLAEAGQQFRILYTATDGATGHGIIAVSGALFFPRRTPPRGGWPIIAWAHGTDGVADICAPSWAGRSYRDVRYLNTWLDQGYAVVATDYQGLGTPGPHPYLQARPEAYSVLDSIRAALKLDHRLANKIVIVGQSQGGGATVATAGYAPAYAPDLHVMGAVATGAPYPTLQAQTLPPTRPEAEFPGSVGYMMYTVIAAEHDQPHFNADDVLTPLARPLLEQARIHCVFDMTADAADTGITQSNGFKPGGLAKLYGPMLKLLLYPTLRLKMPIFIGAGQLDTVVSPEIQLNLAKDACAAGSTVEYHSYPGLDHSQTVNASLKDSLPFVRKAFAGETISPMCPS